MTRPKPLVPAWENVPRVVIGMCHLQALPGSPRYGGRTADVLDAALRDVEALTRGGVHAIMIENFGDAPFYPERAPACVVAHMTAIAARKPASATPAAFACARLVTMKAAPWFTDAFATMSFV